MAEGHSDTCRCRPCGLQSMIEARKRVSSFADVSSVRQNAMHYLLSTAIGAPSFWDTTYEVNAARKIIAGEFPGGPDASV